MVGFIIFSARDNHLTRSYQWNKREPYWTYGFVFSGQEVDYIAENCVDWKVKPQYVIKAEYDELEDQVYIIDETRIGFWE